MSAYVFSLEPFEASYPDLEPLYREHYAEMKARLDANGSPIGEFAPRLHIYTDASKGGWLLTYVIRLAGKAVGYSNVYLTSDMHNGELIAEEDTIFVTKAHRNGVGRRLVKHILTDLGNRGVRRVKVSPVTDLRVGKIWERMGFKPVAQVMVYTFGKAA